MTIGKAILEKISKKNKTDKKVGQETLLQKIEKSQEKYSLQAILHLREFKEDFDIENFEKYVREQIFIISPACITAYLQWRAAENHKESEKNDKLEKIREELEGQGLAEGHICQILQNLNKKI